VLSRVIVYYKVSEKPAEEEFKVDWKKVEATVKEKFSKLKLVYSRGG
jgi:hypothetical protein